MLIGKLTSAVYKMQLDGRVQTLEEAKDAAESMIKELKDKNETL
jgi:hypothetical protein